MSDLFDAPARRDPHASKKGRPLYGQREYAVPDVRAVAVPDEGGPELLGLQCPRADCGRAHYVDEGYAFDHAGECRPCPYCFRVSILP